VSRVRVISSRFRTTRARTSPSLRAS
jgi:hypothetical protein